MKTPKLDPFWERTKKLLRAHKITQKKFSAYIGIKYATLKSWLYFSRLPDVYTACDIADALGVSVNFLVRGDDTKAVENREHRILKRKSAAAEIKKMALQIRKSAGNL